MTDLPVGEEIPKVKRTAKANRQRMQAFAAAYGDPSSPTCGRAKESVRKISPNLNEGSLETTAARWLRHPYVIAELTRHEEAVRTAAAVTASTYIAKALDYTEYLMKRGDRGDATAATRYYELAGKAAGLFVTKTEDLTPASRRIPPADVTLGQLQHIMTAMQNLSQPNPLPPASLPRPTTDAEYTIEPANADAADTEP